MRKKGFVTSLKLFRRKQKADFENGPKFDQDWGSITDQQEVVQEGKSQTQITAKIFGNVLKGKNKQG
jgi:hypothetical protein